MFLKNLIDIWKGEGLLRQMLDKFDKMMEKADWMFDMSRKVFKGELEPEKIEADLFRTDKEINDMEKNIRRQIIELLTINPQADVPACLVLMSVVKDAERTGDYCKNLFELVPLYGAPVKNGETIAEIVDILDKIEVIHSRTRKAFKRSDSDMAQESIETARKVCRRCDELVEGLMDSSYSAKKAVVFTLAFRYMKRIAAHLANICTTILKPLPEIDYFNEL